MTDITMAIDPQAAQHRWERRYEWHLGSVPKLLGAMLTLAAPSIGVSRAGSQFDRPQITGGGYYDTTPTARMDQKAGEDAAGLWALLADYASAVSEWLDAPTSIPARCPAYAQTAHDTALLLVGALIDQSARIYHVHELDDTEAGIFREIRRLQGRYLPDFDGLPQHGRDCVLCGAERSVRARWVDAPAGGVRPVMRAACRVCGMDYSEGETDEP
jgi:hypothetical protein